jgi:exosortase/archaeosortase family protein
VRRAWPLAIVLGACFPAARWWYEHVRYASEEHVELFALLGAVGLLALAARAEQNSSAAREGTAATAGTTPASLWPCALFLCAYAAAWRAEFALPGAACAALALAAAASVAYLGSALRLELAGLALLCLPLVPLFQFQVGHVLRAWTASAAAAWLELCRLDAASCGTGLIVSGRHVWVDEPCSGLRGLWAGAYTACAAALLWRLSAPRTLLLAAGAALLLLGANALRAAALALVETGPAHAQRGLHEGIGVAVDAAALIALALLARRLSGVRACAA